MIKPCFLLLLIAVLSACGSGDRASKKTPLADRIAQPLVRGSFQITVTGGQLHDCLTDRLYKVQVTPAIDSLYRTACGPITYPGEKVYAVLRGSPVGDVFTFANVDAMEAKNPWNTCVRFEFWCHGNEPFWDLEISQAEGGLFYQDASRENGAKYAWAAPKISKSTWTYRAPAPAAGESALQVVIRKEPANDGMSDLTYNYSVELTVNGEKRKGVAVRWGEPKLEPK